MDYFYPGLQRMVLNAYKYKNDIYSKHYFVAPTGAQEVLFYVC